jgi:hypothetical protein
MVVVGIAVVLWLLLLFVCCLLIVDQLRAMASLILDAVIIFALILDSY